MYWGAVSDRIGRKRVIIMGTFGTLSSLLLVGLAPNFWVALAGRLLGGALNGNIGRTPFHDVSSRYPLTPQTLGVIQTVVGEIVKRPEHERA